MTVAFIGKKKDDVVDIDELITLIKNLIEKENADTFLFESTGYFDLYCYAVVCKMKKDYPHIRRIYIHEDSFKAKTPDNLVKNQTFEEVKNFSAHDENGKVFHAGKDYMLRKSNLIITNAGGKPWVKNGSESPDCESVKRPAWKLCADKKNIKYMNLKTVKRIITAKRTDVQTILGRGSELTEKLRRALESGKQNEITVNDVFAIAEAFGVSVTALL